MVTSKFVLETGSNFDFQPVLNKIDFFADVSVFNLFFKCILFNSVDKKIYPVFVFVVLFSCELV